MSSIIKPLGNLPVTSLLAAVLLATSAAPGRAQPAPGAASAGANGPALPTDLQPILASEVPATAAYFVLELWPYGPPGPPGFYAGRTDLSWFVSPSTGLFFVDDPSVTGWFQAPASAGALGAGQADASSLPFPPAGGGSSGGTNGPAPAKLRPPRGISWGQLWLEALVDTNYSSTVDLVVHVNTNVAPPGAGW
jgi:hypothetical protein